VVHTARLNLEKHRHKGFYCPESVEWARKMFKERVH